MERRSPPLAGHCCSNKRSWPQGSSVLWRKGVQQHPQVSGQEYSCRLREKLVPAWTELSRISRGCSGAGALALKEKLRGCSVWRRGGFRGIKANYQCSKVSGRWSQTFHCSAVRTRDEGVSWNKFRQAIRRKFSRGTMSQWSSLLWTIVKIFSTCLDKAQSNVLWPHDWPCFEQEVELDLPTCLEWSCHHELTI